ncbi:DNA-binding transcriptional repressor AcrR [Methanobrevibacter cuticularis]|uniref:DNA-binding transcriptional repressor AcrR n=1 Tax=Methanobrevibacter cuticularis TaxID=47311 RepID=A0A166FCM7_9EURY|nr:TetR/AcrR family transcriptional regulator [Methanobrevibacter cuticularis]KZX17539.1 DNA-binding transcriptional repressor AcrR [Methanobrevibacter cuticularis]
MSNKDKIAEATFLLALSHGFDNVTIKQIQDTAEVTTGAIYYHFKDKNDILLYLLNKYFLSQLDEFRRILLDYEGSTTEKLKLLFHCHIGSDIRNEIAFDMSGLEINYKDYHLLLKGIYHQHPEFRHLFHDYDLKACNLYKEVVLDLFDKKELRNDIDRNGLGLYIFSLLRGFVETWGAFPEMSVEKAIDENVKLMIDTLKK